MDGGTETVRLVADLVDVHHEICGAVTSAEPTFVSRIGGSDFDRVFKYYYVLINEGPEKALAAIMDKWFLVKRHNGFYDQDGSSDNILRFLDLFVECYGKCGTHTVCGAPLLSKFFPSSINEQFVVDTSADSAALVAFFDMIGDRQRPASFYPYGYVERLLRGKENLFRAFEKTLPGKTVLAVTPFQESISKNFENRHRFFGNYNYPEFSLETYNTPITYDGLPQEYYPDLDWFATLERMKAEIGNIDFDIALLSCGSYAVPLGVYIRDILQKKAIYVGGCLQLYFGIMGRRYNAPWFLEQINPSAFIMPLERDRYLKHFNITSKTAKEAFGAYF